MADSDNLAQPYNQRRVLTINHLSDDDLLEIFDFCVVKLRGPVYLAFCDINKKRRIESWQTLIHVCRRWRGLVFGSPTRLNLQLCCLPETPERISLDIWPNLPLLILGVISEQYVDNVVAKLEHSNRIRQIQVDLNRYILRVETLWTAMQVPFPELTEMYLGFGDMAGGPDLPDSFLGGFAPRLRYLTLSSISFPGLPGLLLTATHLVNLRLLCVPHSGYVSPEAMATCLSALTSLELFQLEFSYPQSPEQESRRPHPPTLSVLPALTIFWFRGLGKYFEDLVSLIDAPRVNQLMAIVCEDTNFEYPELKQFIGRSSRFGAYDEARLIFHAREARVKLQYDPEPPDQAMVEVKIPCQVLGRQLSSVAQICTSSLHPLLTTVNLYIYENAFSTPDWKGDIENAVWLRLLRPFTAVKNLYLSKKIAPRIAPALQELTGGRTREVLPVLQKVLIDFPSFRRLEPVPEGIAQFISARQLINLPVTISFWDR